MRNENEIKLSYWIEKLQSKGVYSFSIELAKQELPAYTQIALTRALSRLSAKGKITSIYKGYYLIIPPQYSQKKILPPSLFIDAIFKYFNRPYYVSLLNAAVFHGASHQQPQEFFIMTNFPVMRPTQKYGLKINYISKNNISEQFIEKRKTEAGYINVSNAVLTATDLIQFEKRVGGLNRVSTILFELAEAIKPADFGVKFLDNIPTTVLQRLGYLLEYVCENKEVASALYKVIVENGNKLYRIPLKSSGKVKEFSSNNRWNIIENISIETDF